jgi:hypothetical protein
MGAGSILFFDIDHLGVTRPAIQPRTKLLERRIVTAGPHFDPAVGEINGMAIEAKRDGDVPGTGAKEYALHATADFELTAHRQRCSGKPAFSAFSSASSAFCFACTASLRAAL